MIRVNEIKMPLGTCENEVKTATAKALKIRESDDPDRQPVDFTVEDRHDNVAWVWGNNPQDDVQCECTHPTDHGCIEFGDDDEQGTCILCGAKCDWHYETDEGNVEEYYWKGKSRCVDEWYYSKKIGGIIGEYLKELQDKNA